MAENDATTGAQVNPQASADAGEAGGMIPKARFDEVNSRMKSAERKLAQLVDAEEARSRADLEAKGKWEELRAKYEERLAAVLPKAEQFDAYVTQRRETLLAGLTDADKTLADGLPLEKLEVLVERLKQQAPAGQPAVQPPARPGSPVPSGRLTPEQVQKGVRDGGQKFLRENWSAITGT